MKLLKRINSAMLGLLEFQSRMWVVNVSIGTNQGESYVVNEDSFSEPMHWMKRKGYSEAMIAEVETMQRSQVKEFALENVTHRLIRVK